VTIEATVQAAILQRRVLRFTAAGDPPPERTGHPHALFLGVSGGTYVAVLQVGGFTDDGHPLPRWRSFDLDALVSVQPLDDAFDPDPGWDPLSDRFAGGIVAMV
jgi:hypothetical protein